MREIPVPIATESPVAHADWVELITLQAVDKNTSIRDLASSLRRTGSAEELSDADSRISKGDLGWEASLGVAESAFAEIDDRLQSCGAPAYPFDVVGQHLQARNDITDSPYLFLLLLTHFGHSPGIRHAQGTNLFERVCAAAAEAYYGGSATGTLSLPFGFPRRYSAKRFSKALNDLSQRLGEGRGYRDRPNIDRNKDGKLDVVVWKHFNDQRKGKAIAFGQCATGANWRSKTSELNVRAFCGKWLIDQPTVEPVRLFFVPHRVHFNDWEDVCFDGGILFDRCRIASLAMAIEPALREECRDWSLHVHARKLA